MAKHIDWAMEKYCRHLLTEDRAEVKDKDNNQPEKSENKMDVEMENIKKAV